MDSRTETTTSECCRRHCAARSALLLCLWYGFVVTACSLPPKHEYELAPGQAYNASLRVVLLVPINETETLPAGLEKGEEAVLASFASICRPRD